VPELPVHVVIRCTVEDEPLAGAIATVRLPMWSKNQYALAFGPSDAEGFIRVSGDELAARTNDVVAASPMDYLAFPGGWTGGLGAEVIDLAGVQRLRDAMGVWGEQFYPADFARTLDAYERRLHKLEGRQLRAEVARTE
jgi:hypothetical protein